MRQFEKYLACSDFKNYEDFAKRFEVKVPENFNFAYDVVDELGREKPDKPALFWVSEDAKTTREISFGEMSRL